MAAGLLGFLGFGKRSKPNLTQNYQAPPSASSAPLFGGLKRLAERRLGGQDLGFGEDYLNKATNAPIASREARFNEIELPQLSSQLSSRGLARSAGPNLATDVLTRAGQNKERDINDLLAQFYQLNQVQRKADVTEGIRVGDQLNTQYLNQGNQSSSQFNAAERGNTERTAQSSATDNAADRARQNQVIGTLMNAIAPGSGQAFSGAGGGQIPNYMTNQPMPTVNQGGFPMQTSTYGPNNVPTGFEGRVNPGSGPQVGSNILGSMSSQQAGNMNPQQLAAILAQIFGG